MSRMIGVYVPFQFDLGGSLIFSEDMLRDLKRTLGKCELSPVRTRSFNISYLSRHAPIVRVTLRPTQLTLVETKWTLSRLLVIYPWLGTVAVGYHFQPRESPTPENMMRFYDELIGVIDQDYLKYLDDHGQMKPALQLKTKYVRHAEPSDLLLGQTVDQLRDIVAPYLKEARPLLYYFMNFRVMYMWPRDAEKGIDRHVLQALLDLRRTASRRPLPNAAMLDTDVARVWSNGWVTVAFVENAAGPNDKAPPSLVLGGSLNLCHAQWFLCQIWISISLQTGADDRQPFWTRDEAQRLADSLYSLERDLSEVTNLDTMLRDPVLIELAQFFQQHLKVHQHLRDAQARLSLLTQYLRGRLDIEAGRTAAKLEILFALSAAAAVAALVQPVRELWQLRVLAVIVVVLLFSLFLAFSPTRQWMRSLRVSRPKGKARPDSLRASAPTRPSRRHPPRRPTSRTLRG